MSERTFKVRPQGADYEIQVMGGRTTPLRDFYHSLLRARWPFTMAIFAGTYLAANGLFAVAYMLVGGLEGAEPGSFQDAFFFSVQTMGTIGYGSIHPRSAFANWIMVLESIVGLALTALSTGLVFAKLSRPTARVVFSESAVITNFRGKQTLMLRVGNERGNSIVNAQFSAVLSRTERDGQELFYRAYDLILAREHALSLNRSFTLMHTIDEQSPFYGQNAETIAEQEYELSIMIVGTDDTSMQTVHASHIYYPPRIRWGFRLVDILSEADGGSLVLDLRKFHDVEPMR